MSKNFQLTTMLPYLQGFRGVHYGLSLYLHPDFVHENSQGSGKSVHMHRLAQAFVAWQCNKYCKFGNLRENFMFAKSVKRHTCELKNSQVRHYLPISMKAIMISPFHEGFVFMKLHLQSFAKIKPSRKFLNLQCPKSHVLARIFTYCRQQGSKLKHSFLHIHNGLFKSKIFLLGYFLYFKSCIEKQYVINH